MTYAGIVPVSAVEWVGFLAVLATMEAFALALVWIRLRHWQALARAAVAAINTEGETHEAN